MARRFAISFSQGRIYAHPGVTVRPRDIFAEEEPASWADRLASSILNAVYPSLPFDYSAFPFALTAEGISTLYQALFWGGQDGTELAAAFGPGLGLTQPESPGLFDASGCTVVAIIKTELETRGGDMPALEMIRLLTDKHGLVRPLALLYVLAFVRQVHAEVELCPGHRVGRRQGGLFVGDRITCDLASEVSFSGSLAEQLGALRLAPSVTWNAVLPYSSLIVEGAGPAEDAESVAGEERRLVGLLRRMGSEVASAREALDAMEACAGHIAEEGALQALEAICTASDYREFYRAAQQRFQGPSGLGEALETYRRLLRLATLAPRIAETKRYVDSMTFGRSHEEMRLERDSVAARFELDSLLANPSIWGSIEGRFQLLRARYANAYVRHHVRYYQEVPELRDKLGGLEPLVEALARFNGMPELGEPVGTEVPQLFQDVVGSFRTCAVEVDESSLKAGPYCQACRLPLDEVVPRQEFSALSGAMERAMREYNRRLGSHAVRQVLAHPNKRQVDRFVDMLHVADPSALANVLDDEVVDFLRRFLRAG